MDLHQKYPALSDLRQKAKTRIPRFVWEYLDSATGNEHTKARNRAQLDQLRFMPSILHGEFDPDLRTQFLGREYPLPLGIAPVGMSGLIWPDAERLLAKAAAQSGLPYCLSTVASQPPEALREHIGDQGWFQMYPPRDPEIRMDMLNRARNAGFHSLVLTVDVPVASRRERQTRSGLTSPPRLTPRLLAQIAQRPAWALGTIHHGMPRMRLIDSYAQGLTGLSSTAHAGYLLRTSPDWDYLHWLRDNWQGALTIKGVLCPDDAQRLQRSGADAIWISNHAGRQFDAAPAPIEMLPQIRAACDLPLILDSGIETGLDILRARALGADMVMMGRGFHYALAALGAAGPAHLIELLKRDLIANMGQLGTRKYDDLTDRILK